MRREWCLKYSGYISSGGNDETTMKSQTLACKLDSTNVSSFHHLAHWIKSLNNSFLMRLFLLIRILASWRLCRRKERIPNSRLHNFLLCRRIFTSCNAGEDRTVDWKLCGFVACELWSEFFSVESVANFHFAFCYRFYDLYCWYP